MPRRSTALSRSSATTVAVATLCLVSHPRHRLNWWRCRGACWLVDCDYASIITKLKGFLLWAGTPFSSAENYWSNSVRCRGLDTSLVATTRPTVSARPTVVQAT